MAARKPLDRLPGWTIEGGVLIAVRLTPKSAADQVVGTEEGADDAPVLKVRVRAAPEKNKANKALAALLADWLNILKTNCEVTAGRKSRLKQVLMRGEPQDLMARFKAGLAALQGGQ